MSEDWRDTKLEDIDFLNITQVEKSKSTIDGNTLGDLVGYVREKNEELDEKGYGWSQDYSCIRTIGPKTAGLLEGLVMGLKNKGWKDE